MRFVFGTRFALWIVVWAAITITLTTWVTALLIAWGLDDTQSVLDPSAHLYVLRQFVWCMELFAYGSMGWNALAGGYLMLMVLGMLLVGDLGIQFGLFKNELGEIDKVQNRVLHYCTVLFLIQAYIGVGSWMILYFISEPSAHLASMTLIEGSRRLLFTIGAPVLVIMSGLYMMDFLGKQYIIGTAPPRWLPSPELRARMRRFGLGQ